MEFMNQWELYTSGMMKNCTSGISKVALVFSLGGFLASLFMENKLTPLQHQSNNTSHLSLLCILLCILITFQLRHLLF